MNDEFEIFPADEYPVWSEVQKEIIHKLNPKGKLNTTWNAYINFYALDVPITDQRLSLCLSTN